MILVKAVEITIFEIKKRMLFLITNQSQHFVPEFHLRTPLDNAEPPVAGLRHNLVQNHQAYQTNQPDPP